LITRSHGQQRDDLQHRGKRQDADRRAAQRRHEFVALTGEDIREHRRGRQRARDRDQLAMTPLKRPHRSEHARAALLGGVVRWRGEREGRRTSLFALQVSGARAQVVVERHDRPLPPGRPDYHESGMAQP
jgi:hypothetical protein